MIHDNFILRDSLLDVLKDIDVVELICSGLLWLGLTSESLSKGKSFSKIEFNKQIALLSQALSFVPNNGLKVFGTWTKTFCKFGQCAGVSFCFFFFFFGVLL